MKFLAEIGTLQKDFAYRTLTKIKNIFLLKTFLAACPFSLKTFCGTPIASKGVIFLLVIPQAAFF
jgi:hypothetical protein